MKKVLFLLLCTLSLFGSPKRRMATDSEGVFQRLLNIENERLSHNPFLLKCLKSDSPEVVQAALVTLARIGEPFGFEDIIPLFRRKNKEIRMAAAFALGQMAHPTAFKLLTQNVAMQKDADVIAALLRAIGINANEKSMLSVVRAIKTHANPKILEAAYYALGRLWAGGHVDDFPPELFSNLIQAATGDDLIAQNAAFALSKYKGDLSVFPMQRLLDLVPQMKSSTARAFVLKFLSERKVLTARSLFMNYVQTPGPLGVRLEAAKGLAHFPISEDVLAVYKKMLGEYVNLPAVLLVQLVESSRSLEPLPKSFAEPILEVFQKHASIWVKGEALKALAHLNPSMARQKVSEILLSVNSPLQPEAISALGILGAIEDIDRAAKFITNENPKLAEESIQALQILQNQNLDKYAPLFKTALERGDVGVTVLISELVQKNRWKEFAPTLVKIYPTFASDEVESKIAILNALGVVGDSSQVPLLTTALKDPEPQVRLAATAALTAITGNFVPAPTGERFLTEPTPSIYEARYASRAKVIILTTKGNIRLRLFRETPLTAYYFVRLIRTGSAKFKSYAGTSFHRVVGNFVVQGGDPRGDGYGSPGFLIPDEVSKQRHVVGTVGIATAGKDTGGCQFFINLAPNYHLDGKYTVFAELTEGMDVAERLEIGDKILSARVIW